MDIKAKRIVEEFEEPAADIFAEDVEEYTEEDVSFDPPVQKQRKTSNIVLIILALFLLVFIIAMTVIFCIKDSVPDTLIQYTLGAGGVEALLLAGIKISKVLAGDKSSSGPSDGMG